MKLVALMGSPKGMKGNTGVLLGGVLEGAKGAGAEVTVFELGALKVAPCRACEACHKVGTCSIDDDFGQIRQAMVEADAIVLASPNYINSVTAQMKALFDRCCGPLHLQLLDGKYGAAVVTSGAAGCEEVETYILRFLRTLGLWTVGSVGAPAAQLAADDTRAQAVASARTLGAQLVAAAADRRAFPEQQSERDAFKDRMRQLMTFRREEWPFEYEHWKAAGRL